MSATDSDTFGRCKWCGNLTDSAGCLNLTCASRPAAPSDGLCAPCLSDQPCPRHGLAAAPSEPVACDGCGQPAIAAILAVINGQAACCPDCSTLSVGERNTIRSAIVARYTLRPAPREGVTVTEEMAADVLREMVTAARHDKPLAPILTAALAERAK